MLASLPRYQLNLHVATKRAEFREFTRNLTLQEILTYLGMLNHILPIAYKSAFQFKGRDRKLNEKAIEEIVKNGKTQKGIVSTGVNRSVKKGDEETREITGMIKYLKQHHPGAYCSRPTLIKYRKRMEGLGIFAVSDRRFSDGKRFPTVYEINLLEALLLCEALEEELLGREYSLGKCKKGFLGSLPKHKCFALVKLFNAALGWLGLAYRRVWEDEPLFGAWSLSCAME